MELPTINSSQYLNNAYTIGDFPQPMGNIQNYTTALPVSWNPATSIFDKKLLDKIAAQSFAKPEFIMPTPMPTSARRIIRVYIADKDENIPLEKSILHTGKEELTDLTDQELYFGIPVKSLLDSHNEFRKTVRDKKASERASKDVMLEPIKIRDLVMTVVTIASF